MEKAGRPAFSIESAIWPYCAGACAGSAGFMVPVAGSAGLAGSAGVAGGVDCVVVVSEPLPLSLQAAMPKSAMAEKAARMSFFMISLLVAIDWPRRHTPHSNDQWPDASSVASRCVSNGNNVAARQRL
jgi:hypothetical protein